MSVTVNALTVNALVREARFTLKDQSLLLWGLVLLSLSVLAVSFGLAEVKQQNQQIDHLLDANHQELLAEPKRDKSWGNVAYYGFHFTYDRPSDFAFAAMGQRDQQPWKHRIRMLALEGQIYESDVGNPVMALIGRFDFAFLAAFLAPLVLIILLHDLRSSERTAGRYNLLEATIGRPFSLWFSRASIRAGVVYICLILPLIIASILAGTAPSTWLLASFFVLLYIAFWSGLCYVISGWQKPGSVILMSLLSLWLFTAVIIPAGARLTIDRLITLPSGADILMLQRETVNDAWDLPKEETMQAFYEHHPEWSNYEPRESAFEWQWYYAFQRVGDIRTTPLTESYREGRLQRDTAAAWLSLLAPPSLLERSLQGLANTDMAGAIAYEDRVRAFHRELQSFYYPKFFEHVPFDKGLLDELPEFGK